MPANTNIQRLRRTGAVGLALATLALAGCKPPGESGGAAGALGDPQPQPVTSTTVASNPTFKVKVRVQDEQQKPVDGAVLKLYNASYREVVEVSVKKTTAASDPGWSNYEFDAPAGEYYLADTPPKPYHAVSDSDGDYTPLGGGCTDAKSCIHFEVNASGKTRLPGQTLDADMLVFVVTKDTDNRVPMTPGGGTVPVAQDGQQPRQPLGQVVINVIDRKTNAPLAGATITVTNVNGGASSSAVTGPHGEVRVVTGRGETLRITETPPVDYAVDGNSLGSEPPNTLVVTVGAETSVTFVDSEGLPLPARRSVTAPTPPTVPSTPPPPATTPPTEFVPKTTTTTTPVAPRLTTTTTFREDLPPSAKG